MARSASKGSKGSKGAKKKSAVAAPPPPPTLVRVNSPADFVTHITQFSGSALLAVVSPICSVSTNTIIPYLEKLNNERPALLKTMNLLVLYAVDANRELCEQLQVSTVPSLFAYSYGQLVHSFSGDNTMKIELIAKMAAQQAQEETTRLEAEKAQDHTAAAAAAAAATVATEATATAAES